MENKKLKFRERGFSGTKNPEISQREIAHRELARRAAAESIVLLENNGVLPLATGSKIALYSGGARYTIKGGTGSGSVNNRQNVSVDQGLRNAGFIITTDDWLDDYDRIYRERKEEWIRSIYEMSVPGEFMSLYSSYSSNPMEMPQGGTFTKTDTDVAIYVISRVSGESADRRAKKGDYYLSDQEERELTQLSGLYSKLILILNIGGVMDLSFLETIPVAALVLLSQAGMEGGNALADVLSGKVTPCGKLTDTWAYHYEDYPSSDTFGHRNGNLIQEFYSEGIYVGYRYFDSFGVKPRYPFGYGLSYTSFSWEPKLICHEPINENPTISMQVLVTNTGKTEGREVVQIYTACPQDERSKEAKRLVAFAKTGLLAAGESETLTLSFPISSLASYHSGRAVYYMEKGAYLVYVGTSSTDCQPAAMMTLENTYVLEQLTNICPLLDSLSEIEPPQEIRAEQKALKAGIIEEIEKDGLPAIALDQAVAQEIENRKAVGGLQNGQNQETNQDRNKTRIQNQHQTKTRVQPQSPDQYDIDLLAEEILSQLTPLQKARLCCGQPSAGSAEVIGVAAVHVPGAAGETTGALEEYGVGEMILADGPAGLRLQQHYQENPEDGSIYRMSAYQGLQNRFFGTEFLHEGAIDHYQFCSAIPVGTLLAQSFDTELLEEVGQLIGREMKEFGVTLWLAPGMNIHRNPLCGRNFEYYSEDPLVSGCMAAAITRGVQSFPGIGTTIKHYACNNQEDNRMGVSSIVSERALREIYLKGFEIAVKSVQPKAIMTSYNRINSVHAANSYDLCTTVARKEWGFEGIIMTDWLTTNAGHGSSAVKCIQAGNDLIMPGNQSDIMEILDALEAKKHLYLKPEDLDACALRMLKAILHSDLYI